VRAATGVGTPAREVAGGDRHEEAALLRRSTPTASRAPPAWRRINTVMQACFFALTKLLPFEQALAAIEEAIRKSYGKKGDEVVRRNVAAARAALANLAEVPVPARRRPGAGGRRRRATRPDFVQRVTAVMLADAGDLLPVSAFPPDGTWPVGTARFEKRNIADTSRSGTRRSASSATSARSSARMPRSASAPSSRRARRRARRVPVGRLSRARAARAMQYVVQVAPEDCTGCNLCAVVCPARDQDRGRAARR
jgi:pyruvate-ferredoxin/flavodoxin oxidoreductase